MVAGDVFAGCFGIVSFLKMINIWHYCISLPKKNIQTVINQIYGDDDRSSGIDYKSLRQLEALGLIDYEPTIFVRSFGDIDREYYVIKNNHMISCILIRYFLMILP